MTISDNQISQALGQTVYRVEFAGASETHHGKVRDSFIINDQRAIVVSDRVSAFDFVLGTIPYKGAVLNQIAAWWFQQLDGIGITHHLKSTPHPNMSVVTNARVIPIEVIVRGYLTGSTKTSSWYAYQNLDRVICGIEMPAGMKKNQRFDDYLVTPTTKPEFGHDESITEQQIFEQNMLAPFCESMGKTEVEIWQEIESTALKLFAYGQQVAARQGLILVDTKYEMGVDPVGRLILIDEVHTPDSSRYWIADSYESRLAAGEEPQSLDKEFVRRMIVEAGYDVDSDEDPAKYLTDEIRINASKKYLQLFEKMTGAKLELETGASIEQVLGDV